MNVLGLCAGAGGLELGVKLAVPGARGIAYVEREAYAAATLVSRMESEDLAPAPIWTDLSNFDGRAWRGRVHLVASGDPCQDNSVAGRGAGASGARFLIPDVVRIFAESGALRLFRENVPGNLHEQLEYLIPPLERLGCSIAAGIFSSGETGNSQRRERFFLMADREGGARRLRSRSEDRATEADADGREAGQFGTADVDRLLERRQRYAEKYGNNGFGPTLGQAITLLATPGVPNGGRGMPLDAETSGKTVTSKGRKVQVGLANQASLWPTPRTITGGAESAERKRELGRVDAGGEIFRRRLCHGPTPAARDYRSDHSQMTDQELYGSKGAPLSRTATHRFHHSLPAQPTQAGPKSSNAGPISSPPSPRRKLNPWFVEALMRWPTGWSACGCSETGLILWSQQSRIFVWTLLCELGREPEQAKLI